MRLTTLELATVHDGYCDGIKNMSIRLSIHRVFVTTTITVYTLQPRQKQNSKTEQCFIKNSHPEESPIPEGRNPVLDWVAPMHNLKTITSYRMDELVPRDLGLTCGIDTACSPPAHPIQRYQAAVQSSPSSSV